MGRKSRSVWQKDSVKEHVRDLDGILPEDVNRRKFLGASLATISGIAFSGCLGGDGGGDGTGGDEDDTGGDGDDTDGDGDDTDGDGDNDDVISRDVTFRTAFDPWPNYAEHYVAEIEGFYEDAGISSPDVQDGFGSGDTTQRVGTGEDVLGSPAFAPILTGIGEGMEITMYGMTKARSQFGAGVNMEMFEGDITNPDDWEGVTMLGGIGGTAAGELSQIAFLNAFGLYDTNSGEGDPDGVEIEIVATENADTLWLEQDGETFWESMNTIMQAFASNERNANFDTDFLAAYSQVPLAGYPHIVYTPWLEEDEENREYLARLLTGYSNALKWTMLNPDDALDVMVEEVNPDLQVEDRDSLRQRLAGGVIATNLAPEISQENGLGSILREPVEETTQAYTELLPDLDEAPAVDDIADFEIQENADLATLSDDEWNQAAELTEGLESIYEG